MIGVGGYFSILSTGDFSRLSEETFSLGGRPRPLVLPGGRPLPLVAPRLPTFPQGRPRLGFSSNSEVLVEKKIIVDN